MPAWHRFDIVFKPINEFAFRMNNIAYLAHGNAGYLNECRFSLLKFLQVYNLRPPLNLGVIIYTDKPQAFEAFIPFFKSFVLEPVNDALLNSWIAGTGYVHRAKTKMIQDALAKNPGNLIFFDTDTYLIAPVDDVWNEIDAGAVYLHTKEGILDRRLDKTFNKWGRFLEKAFITYGDKSFSYDKNLAVWNSGVLGLSPQYASVLNDVLLLMDAVYKQFPKHITEQVAVSYCFSRTASIKAAEGKVAHYWNLKEFRQLLQTFFEKNEEESIPALVKKVQRIDALAMMREKAAFDRLPFFQRSLKKLTGNRWTIKAYEKKF